MRLFRSSMTLDGLATLEGLSEPDSGEDAGFSKAGAGSGLGGAGLGGAGLGGAGASRDDSGLNSLIFISGIRLRNSGLGCDKTTVGVSGIGLLAAVHVVTGQIINDFVVGFGRGRDCPKSFQDVNELLHALILGPGNHCAFLVFD
jgi:hypothetical protein